MAPNGEIETVNRQVFEYFGRSLEELKNWGTSDADLPHVVESFTRAMASGIPYHYDQRLRRFDGEYRWFENRGVPIRDDSGRIASWYVLMTDIEDRTRALARLEQMQSDFAHMNRVVTMGQLTASITHEVNQPITAAVTYALAARRFLSAEPPNFREVDDALSLIVKEGNRAGEVVERVRALIKKVPAQKDAVAIDDAILEIIALTVRRPQTIACRCGRNLRRACRVRRSGPTATSDAELNRERHSGHEWYWGRRARITDQHRCRPVRRWRARRGAGHRPGAEPGEPLTSVRAILRDQARGHGHGPIYLPLDHRSPRRTAVGECERALRRHISIHVARPHGPSIVMGAETVTRRLMPA
jgi:PAS domain S-box-containing protein